MRVIEFATNLFMRYAPTASESMASLKDELNRGYINILNQMEIKKDKNNEITAKAEGIKKELDGLDVHTPEYANKLKEFQDLHFELEKPTFMERVVTFFEKPYVKLGLMVAFIFASRYIAKKLTQKDEPKIEDIEENPVQNFSGHPQYGNYPPVPPQYWGYSPYGNNPPQFNGTRR
ncbi:hypothetical protein DBR40_19975 [Pedobacter sp. KBW01]|nr:hypothetical protein DBR40_19975 [Pedobacter sp. KBW01]